MKSFKKMFGDLPVTLKVVFLIFFVALAYFAKEACYMYVTLKSNVESLSGARMEFVARTAALVINGDSHQQIVKAYLDRDPDLTKREDFKKIQRLLRRIQKINEVGSDIYTLVQPQWKENSLVFITMSNPKTYVGNSIPVNPAALECLRSGKPTTTGLYQDRKGTWISAYAPIRNKKRSVIAMVAVDYRVDDQLAAAMRQVLEWAGLPSLALFFFFLIIAALVGRSIASPLEEMTDAVTSVADGVPGGNIFTLRRDEIGKLAQAVNTMLESSSKNNLDSRGELSTLRENKTKLTAELKARELELKRTVQAYQALLGKLDEGCLIFLRDGKVLPQYSKICEEYLETTPDKLPIWTVLGMNDEIGQSLIEEIFEEEQPIHSLLAKLPATRRRSNGRRIHLTYHPLRNSNKEVTGVVVIASTEEPLAATNQTNRATPPPLPETTLKFADRIRKYKHQIAHYIRNTRGGLHVLRGAIHNTGVLRSDAATEILEEIRSGATLFSLKSVEESTKLVEEAFSALKSNPGHAKFVDQFETQMGELHACIDDFVKESENLLGLELHSNDHTLEISHRELIDFSKAISEASSPKEIKESFDAHFVREPVHKFVNHFNELVDQLAAKHGKRINPLRITGGETRIVPEAYLELLAELLHPLKNAVEFGIELPAERQAAGKSESGNISLHISLAKSNEADWLFITVEDDGAGINVDALKQSLIRQGDSTVAKASDYQVVQRILNSHFTTHRSDDSETQRGEGLHHLQQSAKDLGGSVEVMSVRGRGTQISIMVPYKENIEENRLPLIDAA